MKRNESKNKRKGKEGHHIFKNILYNINNCIEINKDLNRKK